MALQPSLRGNDELQVNIKKSANLGGGVVGYSHIQSKSGEVHVTRSLSTGLRRSYDVDVSNHLSKDHFHDGKKAVQRD